MTEPRCEGCPYNRLGQQRIPGTNLDRKRIVVAAAPGVEEALSNKPMQGAGGKMVRSLLNGTEVGFTHAVECCPGGKFSGTSKEFQLAMEHCAPRLEAEIAGKDVIALGNEATQAVNGKRRAITKFRGTVTEGDSGTERAVYTTSAAYVEKAGASPRPPASSSAMTSGRGSARSLGVPRSRS